ncbi:recombination mediator RecR [Desulfovermiculus halophilus]|uniref:recombination mediator RecR n=1 Tax=Desulfovermiculus halophilus TaxID=339722 RepID=UPI0004858469|nr:recombination mediator RecR [Desulfovermiculus halophilus]
MDRLPQALQTLVDQLAALPGVGRKSALRIGLTLLSWPEEKARGLGRAICDLRSQLCVCSQCRSLTETDPCPVCSDPRRDDGLLCVVADWDSLLAIDEAGFYQGKYFVLGGLLSPLDGIDADQLAFDLLHTRLAQGLVQEVVLGLGTTREGETTESYVRNLVHRDFPGIRITRLAQGIPVGSDLKYMDRETLKQSMTYRQALG